MSSHPIDSSSCMDAPGGACKGDLVHVVLNWATNRDTYFDCVGFLLRWSHMYAPDNNEIKGIVILLTADGTINTGTFMSYTDDSLNVINRLTEDEAVSHVRGEEG